MSSSYKKKLLAAAKEAMQREESARIQALGQAAYKALDGENSTQLMQLLSPYITKKSERELLLLKPLTTNQSGSEQGHG